MARAIAAHWNYRVIEFADGEERWRAVHEVYYNVDAPASYTTEPAIIRWDVGEGDGMALATLDRMRQALSKPVLDEAEFA